MHATHDSGNAFDQHEIDPAAVLCKAVFNVQTQLGLKQQQLADILGLDRSSINRLKNKGVLSPDSKQGELATMLVRIYRALYVLFGGQNDAMRHWLSTYNNHLRAEPKSLLAQISGLYEVMCYLDASRAKI